MDLRVVVIGRRVFAIGIHSPNLDWRVDYSALTYTREQLPHEVEQKVLSLVQAFGLQFASMDFILTKKGNYVFIAHPHQRRERWVWLLFSASCRFYAHA